MRLTTTTAFALGAAACAVALGLALIAHTDWSYWPVWLLSVNLLTFCAYGFDKAQAKLGGLRVPELVLHGLALGGGFLGGWAGRAGFRHKTRKAAFLYVLLAATVVHGVLLQRWFSW